MTNPINNGYPHMMPQTAPVPSPTATAPGMASPPQGTPRQPERAPPRAVPLGAPTTQFGAQQAQPSAAQYPMARQPQGQPAQNPVAAITGFVQEHQRDLVMVGLGGLLINMLTNQAGSRRGPTGG